MRCHNTKRNRERETERHHFSWNIWKLKRLFQNFSHNLQLFHIVSSLVAEICKWGKCIGRSVFLIHYVPAYVTLSHNCTNVKYGCNSFFSMLSFTKPVTSIGSMQVAGSIAVSSLQRAKHWLHAVALQGAPKIVREIVSMTSVWICLVRLFELSHTNKVTWFYSLLSMSLVRRYP